MIINVKLNDCNQIGIGNAAHARYDEYNEVSQDEEAIAVIVEAYDKDHDVPLTIYSSCVDYIFDPLNAWRIHQEKIDRAELMHFYSMRKEFILQRDPLPPHDPVPKNMLPQNFDYAEYLADCMGDFLCELIETTPPVWAVVWLTALAYMLFVIMVGIHSFLVPMMWVLLAFIEVALIYAVHVKCTSIMKYLVNPTHLRPGTAAFEEMVREAEESEIEKEAEKKKKKKKDDEEAKALAASTPELEPLVPEGESQLTPKSDEAPIEIDDIHEDSIRKLNIDAPAWTLKQGNVLVDNGYLTMCLGEGKMVHRQHQLFWFSEMGPDFNTFCMKTHLLLQSIYMAVLGLIFYPLVYSYQGLGVLLAYIFVSLIPIALLWTGFYAILISNMSHIACAGLLVNKEVVASVIRKQKTEKAFKLIMLLTKVAGTIDGDEPENPPDFSNPKVAAKVKEIEAMFRHFDKDNDGILKLTEIDGVLDSMGVQLDENAKQRMLIKLDGNGDGEISFEEFRDWQLNLTESDDSEDLKKTAKKLFEMFDESGDGSLSIEEFKVQLDKLNAGLTVDEIVAMLREFDTDGDGEISLEEFEKVIESAYSVT